MVPLIGLMMAVYCCTRLMLLPKEMSGERAGAGTNTLVIVAVLLIGFMSLGLMLTGGGE